MAHILNRSLQAFLLASSKEALITSLEAAEDSTGDKIFKQFYEALNTPAKNDVGQSDQRKRGLKQGKSSDPHYQRFADFTGWRQISALRKLHNIAVWLRSSSIHSDLWDENVGLRLGIDNDTRWNSWYNLLEHTKQKKTQIRQFLLDHEKELRDNMLSISDWDFIERNH